MDLVDALKPSKHCFIELNLTNQNVIIDTRQYFWYYLSLIRIAYPNYILIFSALAEWNNILKVLKHQPDPSLRTYTIQSIIYLSAIGLYRYNLPISWRVICEELEVEPADGWALHEPEYQLMIFDTIQRILGISDLLKFFKDNVQWKSFVNCVTILSRVIAH